MDDLTSAAERLRASVPPPMPIEVLRRRAERRRRRRAQAGGLLLATAVVLVLVVAFEGSDRDPDEGRNVAAGRPSQPTATPVAPGACAGCPPVLAPLVDPQPVGVQVDGYLRLTQPWSEAGTTYAPPGDRRPRAPAAQAVAAVRAASGLPKVVVDEPASIVLGVKTDATRGINPGTLVYVLYRIPASPCDAWAPTLGGPLRTGSTAPPTTTATRGCLLTTEVVADTAQPSGFLGVTGVR